MFNQVSVPMQADSCKQTGFSQSITELNHQVEVLAQRFEVLYHRIEPLINPQQKAVNPPSKQPTVAKPTALMEIDSISEKLEQLRNTLDECISRLEI